MGGIHVHQLSELLQDYIVSKITYLGDPVVSGLTSLNNGWESDVYSFTLSYTDNGRSCKRQMILRAYTGKDVPLFPNKPLHEFNVLRQLGHDGYPVPGVYLLECDDCYLGSPFVIMEFVEGKGLDGLFYGAEIADKKKLLSLGAELFVELHRLDVKPYLEDDSDCDNNPVFKEINRHAEMAHLFEADYARPCFQWLREQAKEIKGHKLALAHWDYHFGNIILTSDQKPVVIDWTISYVTDYRFDLSWSLLFMGDDAAAEYFVTAYEQASGHKVEHLEFFRAFACLRRLLTMLISIEHGADSLGMRPGAESIIRKHKVHMQEVYAMWVQLTKLPIPHVESVIAGL